MKKQVIEETLKKIKQDKIEPTPKWHFQLKNYAVWLSFIGLVFLGGISLGLLIYFSLGLGQEMADFSDRPQHLFAFWRFLPHFWLALIPIVFFLAFLIFRKTKNGYHYDNLLIFLGLLFSFVLLGNAVYFSNNSEKMNNCVFRDIPYYEEISYDKERMWSRPELGFLGGKIIKLENDNLNLEDFVGTVWLVNFDEDIKMGRRVSLVPDVLIKIIGQKTDENVFEAEEIRSWERLKGASRRAEICPMHRF